MKVALVEEARMGGTCLHWGCIPTKALLESSELLYRVRDRGKEFGINVQGLAVDYPTLTKRKDAIVSQLTKGIEGLMRKNKIEIVSARGTVTGKNSIQAGDRRLEAANLLLAPGSPPPPPSRRERFPASRSTASGSSPPTTPSTPTGCRSRSRSSAAAPSALSS